MVLGSISIFCPSSTSLIFALVNVKWIGFLLERSKTVCILIPRILRVRSAQVNSLRFKNIGVESIIFTGLICSEKLEFLAFGKYNKNVNNLTAGELYDVVGTLVISDISPDWQKSISEHIKSRRACYFSAEFLVGQPMYKNLMCLDIEEKIENALSGFDRSLKEFETLPDEPLGNGGLGRLAACFLDSAANLNVALDGYGIKYRFGLFKQEIENGFQI